MRGEENMKNEKKEWTMERIVKWTIGIVAAIVLFFLVPNIIFGMWLDYFWFESLGFGSVFLTNLGIQIQIFFVLLVITYGTFVIIWKRILKPFFAESLKEAKKESKLTEEDEWKRREGRGNLETLKKEYKLIKKVYFIPALVVSLIFSYLATGYVWFSALLFSNGVSFGLTDPVFGEGLGFYFYVLPFIDNIIWIALYLAVIAIVTVFLVNLIIRMKKKEDYYLHIGKALKDIETFNWRISFFVLCIILALKAWFTRYSILYSDYGVVYGAGHTDVIAGLWQWNILTVALILLAITILLGKEDAIIPWMGFLKRKYKIDFGVFKQPLAVIIVVILVFSGFWLAGSIIQGTRVGPNELEVEGEYIDSEISFTRYGFDLNDITETEYSGKRVLNLSVLQSPSIKNTRISDYRAFEKAYDQMQTIRQYYDYADIDIDRYMVNGNLTVLLLGPRELDVNKLPAKAKTWQNQHLVYTHGIGITVSPVNEVTEEGLPKLLVKNIPPVSEIPELTMKQPMIYYGEKTDNYIITNTRQNEFDYPSGEENVYLEEYPGSGGIKLTGIKKLAAAVKIDLISIFLSKYLTEDSRIHLYRNIKDRLQKVAPFIYWDQDPYIYVDDEGEATYFITMGVTHNDQCPYSKPGKLGNINVNYVRNSVVSFIDVLNGTVDIYKLGNDPLTRTYEKIYPALFKDISEMPERFASHFKYPEDLFGLQVGKFNTYHMNRTNIFYNQEDKWEKAKEIYRGDTQRVEPYNQYLEIGTRNSFFLTQPVTPQKKNNMIAWIAVDQDPPNYGQFICFKFPKGSLSYGPMQIEAMIDQNEEISKLTTLWGQKGSEIIRGNLLVVPVQDSVLYVEPMYLSSEASAIPELKKIIVVYYNSEEDRKTVSIGDSLEEAITNAIYPGLIPEIPEEPGIPEEIPSEVQEIIDQFKDEFDQLMEDFLQNIEDVLSNETTSS